jgi:hypothetical protein
VNVTCRPATGVPEASAVVTSVTVQSEQPGSDIPGVTTVVGYTVGEAMVVDGRVFDASQHPVTLGLYLGVKGETDPGEVDDSIYTATWLPSLSVQDTSVWPPSYRSDSSINTQIRFTNSPEYEPNFGTWYYGTLREVPAMVFEDNVSGRVDYLAGNCVVAAVVLGGTKSEQKTGLFSWDMNPKLQMVVSDSGEIQALYGSDVLTSLRVFLPTTARPIAFGALLLGRRVILCVNDGSPQVVSAVVPKEFQIGFGAPLFVGQATVADQVVYADMAVLKVAAGNTDEAGVVEFVNNIAAEFGIEHRP